MKKLLTTMTLGGLLSGSAMAAEDYMYGVGVHMGSGLFPSYYPVKLPELENTNTQILNGCARAV